MKESDVEVDVYTHAKKRVDEIKGFWVHLGVFAIINAGIFAINMIASPNHLWFYWPLLGWGIAVVIHAFTFFVEDRWLGPEWEQRKVDEIIARHEDLMKKGA